ncbi:MAG TPA: FAD-dependent oxidoreductase [Polyangiaceae bacterium]|nr:FAD-dependent oxidoreductase [Polyangiaceae bacterium]
MTPLRARSLQALADGTFDVLVVGGGINGAVAAACLAGRGARVGLVDRSDFASGTSQQSSNLAWGGIKYMETFELGLVRKLCVSRNHLIRSYPSTVEEIRFFAAHQPGFRHGRLKLFLGTLLYWLLGSFFTKPPRLLSRAAIAAEEPIIDLSDGKCDGGFEYSDAYFHDNDARFVWGFVRRALDAGAAAANYLEVSSMRRGDDDHWVVTASDRLTGKRLEIRAKVIVNACGPWVDPVNREASVTTTHRHVFSKGIHLIVRRLTEHTRVLTFFADDGRLFFVIPMGTRTAIGTTDTRVETPDAVVTDEDRAFVLSNINKRLALSSPLTEDDIIAERCGVRPLAVAASGGAAVDWMQLSRKHEVEVDARARHISVFGGKLTDCLNVGEEIAAEVERLGVELPNREARWFGEPEPEVRARFFARADAMGLDRLTSRTSSEPLSVRFWRRYGDQAFRLLDALEGDRTRAELVIEGAEYARCELELAAEREMIEKLEDFMRRRSKIALVMRRDEIESAPGLPEACAILFGEDADERLAEYFVEAAR